MQEPSVPVRKLTIRQPLAIAMLALVPSLFTACSGSSSNNDKNSGGNGGDGGDSGGNAGGDSGGGGGGGTSLGGNAGGGPGTNVMLEGACGPLPPAPARRLSRVEYVASLREVFPFAFKPDADGVYRIDNHSFALKRGTQTINWNWKDDVIADPGTYGFQNRANNLNATAFQLEAYDDNAVLIAELVAQPATLASLVPCQEKTVDCGKKFIDAYGPKFFRRPMTDAEKTVYYDFFKTEFDGAKADDAAADNFMVALRLTLEVFLQSPQFMYRLELGDPATKKNGAVQLTQYEIANRLSYGFWSTMPDADLMTAASKGELKTADQLEAQARRMLKDNRFRYMVIEYFRQWADLERIFGESYRQYPGTSLGDAQHSFSIFQALGSRHEIEQFVEWTFADSDATFNTLFTSTKSWVNKYTKGVYEGKLLSVSTQDPDFVYTPMDLNPAQRAGILTRAFFGWAYSHFGTPVGVPNPPVRGNFVLQKVFCQHFPPPPADAQTRAGAVQVPAGSTNREEFAARMKAADICNSCHQVLDPLGFAFENYNEVGFYITKDQKNPAKTIDASGKVDLGTPTDVDGPFANAVDLSKKLGKSKSAAACLTQQWYEYLTGRDADGVIAPEPSDGADACRIKKMVEAADAKGGDLREAFVAWVKSPDFQWRPAY
ncbi:MAG: DUF1592 domain-containing protein [Deltaproteobacteria bacterium]|nr:DUF1592 domain-containing protein [Deltaproteobacteria bacterium]